MSITTKVIAGTEHRFAPLRVKQIRAIRAMKPTNDMLESFDFWKPLIEDSMQRAGSQMPDVEGMDADTAGDVLAELIRGIMSASGAEITTPAQTKTE